MTDSPIQTAIRILEKHIIASAEHMASQIVEGEQADEDTSYAGALKSDQIAEDVAARAAELSGLIDLRDMLKTALAVKTELDAL